MTSPCDYCGREVAISEGVVGRISTGFGRGNKESFYFCNPACRAWRFRRGRAKWDIPLTPTERPQFDPDQSVLAEFVLRDRAVAAGSPSRNETLVARGSV